MSKTAKEILTEARDLITDPAKWTKGFFARNSEGTAVRGTYDTAVCWCPWGAMQKVVPNVDLYNEDSVPKLWPALHAAFDTLPGKSHEYTPFAVYDFNDHSTHEEVLAAFDKAIERCEA